MVRVSPLRFVFMFTAALAAAGCGKGSSGAHFNLTGPARHDWKAAAQQVLEGHCGTANPSAQQIESTAAALRQFNIEHVTEEGGCLGGFPKPETPQGVDHESCGVGSFLGSTTAIALPPGVCGTQAEPGADGGVPPTPETGTPPTPEAGAPSAPEAGTPSAPEAGTPSTPEAGKPDGGPPETGAPEGGIIDAGAPQPEAAGPSPELEQAKTSLRSALLRANRVLSRLGENELMDNGYAKALRREKNDAQAALSAADATPESIQSALSQLTSAITSACAQANNDLRGFGGSISCQ